MLFRLKGCALLPAEGRVVRKSEKKVQWLMIKTKAQCRFTARDSPESEDPALGGILAGPEIGRRFCKARGRRRIDR
jgi:hypothetical protein